MVSRFSFFHISTTRRISRRVYRIIDSIENIEQNIKNKKEKVLKNESRGDIEGTHKSIIQLIKIFSKEFKLLKNVFHKELIIIYETIKNRKEEKETINMVKTHINNIKDNELKKNLTAKIEKLEKQVDFILNSIDKRLTVIKAREIDVKTRRERTISNFIRGDIKTSGNTELLRVARRKARWEEKGQVKDFIKGDDRIEKTLKKIALILKNLEKSRNPKSTIEKLNKYFEELRHYIADSANNIRSLLNTITEVIRNIEIVRGRLFDYLEEDLKNKFSELLKKGYPEKYIYKESPIRPNPIKRFFNFIKRKVFKKKSLELESLNNARIITIKALEESASESLKKTRFVKRSA